jgi:hypothetical protein
MNSTFPPHVDDEMLLRLLDEDLSDVEGRWAGSHLGDCNSCRSQLDDIRETLSEYEKFHEKVVKASLPPPPKPWARLELRPARRHFSWVAVASTPRNWLLAAAAITVIFLAVSRLQHPPAVKAAELLRKATRAERNAPVVKRTIRMQTRKYKFERPAHLSPPPSEVTNTSDATGIRQLLESAAYSWDDPLSAAAFSQWHDQLADKRDMVATFSNQGVLESYVIHTTTAASPIADASLTLRAADLHAVACTLRFRADETVEMIEIPSDTPSPSTSPERPWQPAIPSEPRSVPVRLAGPGDELLVMAALHRIEADLGEPVDVRREGPNVLVNASGVSPSRQEEIRSALAKIDVVRMQAGALQRYESTEVERRPPPQVDTANPLLAELQARAPDAVSTAEVGDQLIENTENMIERVYALRSLARRFRAEDVAQMTASETMMLNGMIRDHAAVIGTSSAAIRRRLAPVLPEITPTNPVDESWQDLAQGLLADARRLDQSLNATTNSDDLADRKLRAAQALNAIDQRLARLHTLLRP